MKWVKCLYSVNHQYALTTIGKIYEVLSFDNEVVCIINDDGEKDCFMNTRDVIWFEDATAEIRDNKINQILNEVG